MLVLGGVKAVKYSPPVHPEQPKEMIPISLSSLKPNWPIEDKLFVPWFVLVVPLENLKNPSTVSRLIGQFLFCGMHCLYTETYRNLFRSWPVHREVLFCKELSNLSLWIMVKLETNPSSSKNVTTSTTEVKDSSGWQFTRIYAKILSSWRFCKTDICKKWSKIHDLPIPP